MGVLTLLRCAREAGLRVEAVGGKLLVRGPKRAEAVARLLAEHKLDVLAALAAQQPEPLSPSPGPERVMPPVNGEPGLEQPYAERRGRVQELEGVLLHFCGKCGAYGAFGYGVSLRNGRQGRWYCGAHRPGLPGLSRRGFGDSCND